MFGFRRIPIAWRSRLEAVRRFYVRYFCENTPEGRGLRLLRAWLSPSQLEQLDAKDHFDVIGCTTGRRYRICYGTSMNVFELDDTGCIKTGLCFAPAGRLVPGDVMLAQKIALETCEICALLVANTFSVRNSQETTDAAASAARTCGRAGFTIARRNPRNRQTSLLAGSSVTAQCRGDTP